MMIDQHAKRRRFQFGLRKLLLWTAVVALYLGILSLVNFNACLSVSLTCYLILVGTLRVTFGRWGACVGSVAVTLAPLLCLAGTGLLGFIDDVASR
jgi:hypothetical protein